MFVFLILDLSDEIFLISFGSLDHRYGPKLLRMFTISNSVESGYYSQFLNCTSGPSCSELG